MIQEEESRMETLRQHKREVFDGMRACHRSEVDHKGLHHRGAQAMMTAVLTIYACLAASAATGVAPGTIVVATAMVFLVAPGPYNRFLVGATNTKIDADNRRYEALRAEYPAIVETLDLELLQATGSSAGEGDRKQSGFARTKDVLNIYGLCIFAIALIATRLIVMLTGA